MEDMEGCFFKIVMVTSAWMLLSLMHLLLSSPLGCWSSL